MRLSVIQMDMRLGESAYNFAHAEALLRRAAAEGADTALLPETWNTGFFPADHLPERSDRGGEAVKALCAPLARELNMNIVAGSVSDRRGGRVYNTAYVFDRQGNQIAKHRKVHLFDIAVKDGQCYQESATLTAGDQITVFDTEFGKMGICICFDCRFPEIVRLMTLRGARTILVPAAFNMTTGPAHWELMFRGRAVDNQCYMIGTSDARDEQAGYISWGHSLVVSPWGDVVTQMDEKPGIQITKIDLDRVDAIREQLPLLSARRTDLYELKGK